MNTQENQYYNAKPSKLSNIGADVSGANRMRYDTYETTEQKEAREKKRTQDKQIAAIKLEIKLEVLSEQPSIEKIRALNREIFRLNYGFNSYADDARVIIRERRELATDRKTIADFNKLVNAFNKQQKLERELSYNPKYYLRKLRERYQPRSTFKESSGQAYDWNQFAKCDYGYEVLKYLAVASRAVQFGNSVTDNERAYIANELSRFLKQWTNISLLKNVNLDPVAWSFGARGRANSVAYYVPTTNVISVNRNNIGSLVHEIGHYLDYRTGGTSSQISYKTVSEYRATLEGAMDSKSLRYYTKREEIFARAFEQYCYHKELGFSAFAQCGGAFLPELNAELTALIEEALSVEVQP